MQVRCIAMALAIFAECLHGQTKSALPRFEIVAIKPCKGADAEPAPDGRKGGAGDGLRTSPGFLYLGCRTLQTLIQYAYLGFPDAKPWIKGVGGLPEPPVSWRTLMQPVKGGPEWAESEKFTIEAKTEGPQTEAMMRGPMMQVLLEDRFRLRLHCETRDAPVYLLTAAKGGPRLKPAAKGSCIPFDEASEARHVEGQAPWCGWFRASPQHDGGDTFGQTMAGLCAEFSGQLDRDVIDKTGIKGAFDIHLDEDPSAPPDPLASISAALKNLGLRLEPGRAPTPLLMIDHVERPSGN
jgi:uncharacterized protein (TIGR03435 family)